MYWIFISFTSLMAVLSVLSYYYEKGKVELMQVCLFSVNKYERQLLWMTHDKLCDWEHYGYEVTELLPLIRDGINFRSARRTQSMLDGTCNVIVQQCKYAGVKRVLRLVSSSFSVWLVIQSVGLGLSTPLLKFFLWSTNVSRPPISFVVLKFGSTRNIFPRTVRTLDRRALISFQILVTTVKGKDLSS